MRNIAKVFIYITLFIFFAFPKFSIIHYADFYSALLAFILIYNLKLNINFYILLFIIILFSISLFNGDFFWSYHLIRMVLFFLSGMLVFIVSIRYNINIYYSFFCVLTFMHLGCLIELYNYSLIPDIFLKSKIESFDGHHSLYEQKFNYRSTGFFTNFQEAGFYSVITLSFVLVFSSKIGKLPTFILILFTFSTLFLSASRSGLVGIIIVLFFHSILEFKFKRVLLYVTFFLLLPALLIMSISLIDDLYFSRVSLLLKVFDLIFNFTVPSSLSATFRQNILPEFWFFIFGGYGKPWTQLGVSSDIGYIQLLWSFGLLRLSLFILFIFYALYSVYIIYIKYRYKLSLLLLILLPFIIIYSIKGQGFIGIHFTGDFIPFFAGLLNMQYKLKCQY